jgi:hypothetical protein
MSKMFPQFSTLKYKWYRFTKKISYIRWVFSKENFDYDYASILNMLYFKLTKMGLHFARWGVVIDEDRKKQVRTIWKARNELRKAVNAGDIVYDTAMAKFKKKYGFPYESEMIWESDKEGKFSTLKGFKIIAPVRLTPEKEKEMQAFWYKHYGHDMEDALQRKAIKEAFKIIQENIWTWWD